MALIVCSECGKEFSDKAISCPNCGCPIEEVISITVNVTKNSEDKLHCPKCNHEIATGTDTCPECGYPLKSVNDYTKQETKMITIPRKKVLIFSYILYLLGLLCFINAFFSLTSDRFKTYEKLSVLKPEMYKNQYLLYIILAIAFIVGGIVLICVGISLQRGSKPKLNITSSNSIPYYSGSNSEIHCPKCGSTQIQMVPRKWSLLTGFATNKVDRVCMKCKHRF